MEFLMLNFYALFMCEGLRSPAMNTSLQTLATNPLFPKSKGILKIFLGMAPGVGKTCAMLRAGRDLMTCEGVEVLVGIIEAHGRAETAAMASPFPKLPMQRLSYKGSVIEEFDLGAALARRPDWLLIDEFAHSNAPGSLHPKRYLDVLDLLDSGINVMTTLNIQHVESRSSTVANIAGISVTETVPDSILERADDIVLIDLNPEELLKRLRTGKVYDAATAERAEQHFFAEKNLIALRELSLRMLAERVDHDLRDRRKQEGSATTIWKTGNRIMVAVYASPYSSAMIRWTRRQAYVQGSAWVGAYVDQGLALSAKEQRLLDQNLDLVRSLGGEVVTVKDDDIVSGLLRLAREAQATQLVIGKGEPRPWYDLRRIFLRSLTQRLFEESEELDICVIGRERLPFRKVGKGLRRALPLHHNAIAQYAIASSLALAVTILCSAIAPWLGYRIVGVAYLLTLAASGLILRVPAILFMALLTGGAWNYLFIPPRLTWTIAAPEDWAVYLSSVAAGLFMAVSTQRFHERSKKLRTREERTGTLLALTKRLASANSSNEVVSTAITYLEDELGFESILALRSKNALPTFYRHRSQLWSDNERAAAAYVIAQGVFAGKGTSNHSFAAFTHLPLQGAKEIFGSIGVRLNDGSPIGKNQWDLLENLARQIALSLEREILHERLAQGKLAEVSDQLHQTLLSSVSHELKTPLATIHGAASALEDPAVQDLSDAGKSLVQEILEASRSMQRLISNLLDMSRLDSGLLRLRLLPCDLREIVHAVEEDLRAQFPNSRFFLEAIDELPLVQADEVLVAQALYNLMHNSAFHNEGSVQVFVRLEVAGKTLRAIVEDNGKGLPDPPGQVFQKFYKGNPDKSGGTGLGLSVAKAIVDLHGGSLAAEQIEGHGARFVLELPLVQVVRNES